MSAQCKRCNTGLKDQRLSFCVSCRLFCRRCDTPIPPKRKLCTDCCKTQDTERHLARRSPRADDVICPVCGLRFRVLRVEHIKSHGFANAETFIRRFGLASRMSPSRIKEVRVFLKEIQPGDKLSPEHSAAIGKAKRGKPSGLKGRKRSPEFRAKMSEIRSQYCLDHPGPLFSGIRGEWIPCQKAGQKVFVRSSWEKRVLTVLGHYAEAQRILVEPLRIPYNINGKARYYIPDLLVTFDGNIHELWEIKPAEFLADPANAAKIAAGRAYASERRASFRVVTLADIERMERETSREQMKACVNACVFDSGLTEPPLRVEEGEPTW